MLPFMCWRMQQVKTEGREGPGASSAGLLGGSGSWPLSFGSSFFLLGPIPGAVLPTAQFPRLYAEADHGGRTQQLLTLAGSVDGFHLRLVGRRKVFLQ